MSESEVIPLSDIDTIFYNQRKTSTVYLRDDAVNTSEEITQRIWRTVISVAIPIVAIVVMIDFAPYASHMQLLALLMLCIFGQATVRLIWLIYRAKNMYRIHSCSKIIPNWTTMPVTHKIMEWKHESIHSISELSAIKGGEAMTSTLTMSENIWIICVTMLMYRMGGNEKHPDIYNLNFDDMLVVIGAFGLLLRSIWDLNPWSMTQKMVHYIGTNCWFSVIVAYGYQTNWNNGFYIFSALFYTFFVIWTLLSVKANKYNADLDNARKVNIYSKLMLMCEICMLWQGIIAVLLWVYFHDYYYEFN